MRAQLIGLLLSIAAVLIGGTQADAKEGFFTDLTAAPAGVLKAWNATFAFVTKSADKTDIGSAFLVRKTIIGDKAFFIFLTVDHNLKSCPTESGAKCESVVIIQNMHTVETPDSMRIETLPGLRFNDVLIVARMPNLDLALVGLTAAAIASNLPDPLELPKKCGLQKGDALYGVGFPLTSTRANWRHPPEFDVNVVQKRWSQGVYSGLWKLAEVTEPFFGSTVDDIIGDSGGPIVDAAGTAVSLFQKASEGDAYDASEEPAHFGWHSLGPRCETMLRIGAALVSSN